MKLHIPRLSGIALLAAACFVIGISSETASATPYGQLDVAGEKGEYITGGKTYHITGGQWGAAAFGQAGDPSCHGFDVYVDGLPESQAERWFFRLVPLDSARLLTAGTYQFPRDSSPFHFVMTASSRGSSPYGSFTIQQIEVVPDGVGLRLARLSFTFDLTLGTGLGPRGLRGTLHYRDDGGSVPASFPSITKAKYARGKQALSITGIEFEPGATVTVDGTPVTVTKVKSKSIKTKNVTLAPGLHNVVVKNADGGESFPYEIAVFSTYQFGHDDAPEPDDADTQQDE